VVVAQQQRHRSHGGDRHDGGSDRDPGAAADVSLSRANYEQVRARCGGTVRAFADRVA
jgi:hypothetical protein